jgi:hypothetical protein
MCSALMRTRSPSPANRFLRAFALFAAALVPSGAEYSATAAGPQPAAASPVPQVQAYRESERLLQSFVHSAYRGECSQHDLREARVALESALAVELERLAFAFIPGDRRAVEEARAAFNQQIMRSQEWEYFGPVPQPEWGWYPDRVAQSEGISLRVEDGATVVDSVTPGVIITWR